MYIFFKKDDEWDEIYCQARLGGVKVGKSSDKNSNISDFTENKIILLMFSGNQDLVLGVYTDLIIVTREKLLYHISSVI